jgi:hypothetical protein
VHIYVVTSLLFKKQLIGNASLIKEMSGKNTSVTYSTYFINNPILCSGKLKNKIKVNILVEPILYRPFAKIL